MNESAEAMTGAIPQASDRDVGARSVTCIASLVHRSDDAKVLIVEDQPAVAKALRMLFDLNDIETESTSSPDAALRAIERRATSISCCRT